MKKIRFLTTAAVIAALYAALTYAFSFMSYGGIQFRVAELLTVLPFYSSAAVPGLAVGCLLANLASPMGPIDMAIGTGATLIAALLTRVLPKRLAPIPPIVCNAVIVGLELTFVYHSPLWYNMATVAFGEAVVCLAGGYLFMAALDRVGRPLFGDDRFRGFSPAGSKKKGSSC
jgi:Predicted membrane protein